jgi:predicted DsbA family dithiol-disulfide isomerase
VLTLAEYAREKGKIGIFRTLAMNAYWQDNKNLEDKNELGRLAAAAGLDEEESIAALTSVEYLKRVDNLRDEANNMGIQGIPTFFIGKEIAVGCQPYQVLADMVSRAGGKKREPSH